MMYPEVQKKAQAEIDNAIGHRLPTMADRPQLAYIDAIIKEVSRWHMLGPFGKFSRCHSESCLRGPDIAISCSAIGAPHSVDSDDFYKGYFIPKGSIILPNMGCANNVFSCYGPVSDMRVELSSHFPGLSHQILQFTLTLRSLSLSDISLLSQRKADQRKR